MGEADWNTPAKGPSQGSVCWSLTQAWGAREGLPGEETSELGFEGGARR